MATPPPFGVVNGMIDGVVGSDVVAPSDEEEIGNVKLAFEPEGTAHFW